MTDLTVVIPVRDDARVGQCIASFDDERVRPLVVMNDPTDEVRTIVDSANCDNLTLPVAGGPAACEAGIREASTDAVLMMDSDCTFYPGTLSIFRKAIGSADFVRGITLFRHHTRAERLVSLSRVRHTNMSNMLFKVPLLLHRHTIGKLGGHFFDKRLSWTEDYDLTMRARAAGSSVRWLRDAIVLHDALSIRRDLLSAFRYGQGHYEGLELGLDGYKKVSWSQSLQIPFRTIPHSGLALTAYDYVFTLMFTAGFKSTKTRRTRL